MYALSVVKVESNYVIDNGIYTAVVSEETGMIESLKINGNDFEIVSDYPSYSMFFVEFVYEDENGIDFRFDHPDDWGYNDVKLKILQSTENVCIMEVVYTTDLIDSRWMFFFEDSIPYIRTVIDRVVERSGIYSNFQQCTMYNSDMDNSFIVNYLGDIELTMGDYSGDFNFVAPFKTGVDYSVWTAQHSMWTVHDFGEPTYFPFIAWSDNESGVFAGAAVTWSSANQRETLSYHGGGSTKKHPGFSEAQWNWFGKSDAESLYLHKGTRFGMEMYFYQGAGSIDSLFQFCSQSLGEAFKSQEPEAYTVASWGGRSSPHQNYYWRFPQASNNHLNSQELWQYKSFAIPRSQNGTGDMHFFNIDLIVTDSESSYSVSPIHGTEPLFTQLVTGTDADSSWGEVRWAVNDLPSWLRYTVFENERRVRIEGKLGTVDTDNIVQLDLSSRIDSVIQHSKALTTLSSLDPLFDTLSVAISGVKGIDSVGTKSSWVYYHLTDTTFSMDITPVYGSIPSTEKAVVIANKLSDTEYNESFVRKYPASISYRPSGNNYVYQISESENTKFNLYITRAVDSLLVTLPVGTNAVYVRADSEETWEKAYVSTGDSYQTIHYDFTANQEYIITTDFTKLFDPEQLLIGVLFPNPSREKVTFILSNNERMATRISIFNLLGRELLSEDVSDSINEAGVVVKTVDISNFNSGLYFLSVAQGANINVHKFSVIH